MQRYQKQFKALGSEALYTLVGDLTETTADKILQELERQTTAFEQRFSRFKEDSELTHLNNHAGEKVVISCEFEALLRTAARLSKQTNGLYNPFILPSLQKAGYVGAWPEPSSVEKATDFRSRKPASIDALEIGDGWTRIPSEAALDFGGIGKGYLLDELADTLEDKQLAGYWLSLGGDITLMGQDIDGHAWQVGVANADEPSAVIDTIIFDQSRQAIATSGVTKRRGTSGDKQWHHIIDPRTGRPADTKILTATIVEPRAQLADVYAKCIVIEGAKLAADYLDQGKITSYYLQQTVEPHVISAPKQETTKW